MQIFGTHIDAVWNKDKDKMNNPYDCNYFKPKVAYRQSKGKLLQN